MLSKVSNDSILDNLKKRFGDEIIYVTNKQKRTHK